MEQAIKIIQPTPMALVGLPLSSEKLGILLGLCRVMKPNVIWNIRAKKNPYLPRPDNHDFTISDEELIVDLPLNYCVLCGKHYARTMKALHDLDGKTVCVPLQNGKGDTVIINSVILKVQNYFLSQSPRKVRITMPLKLSRQLFSVAHGYETVNTTTITNIHSPLTRRLYLYLLAWVGKGQMVITEEKLRTVLSIPPDTYADWKSFHRHVLCNSRDDMEAKMAAGKCELSFTFTVAKSRNKPRIITFTINCPEAVEEHQRDEQLSVTTGLTNHYLQSVLKMDNERSDLIIRSINKGNMDKVKAAVSRIISQCRNTVIHDPENYAFSILSTVLNLNKSICN